MLASRPEIARTRVLVAPLFSTSSQPFLSMGVPQSATFSVASIRLQEASGVVAYVGVAVAKAFLFRHANRIRI